jgi:hypothetical protein
MPKTVVAAMNPHAGAMRTDYLFDDMWEAAAIVSREIGEEVTVGAGAPHLRFAGDALIADVVRVSPEVLTLIGQAQAHSVPIILLAKDPGSIPTHLRVHPTVLIEGEAKSSRVPRLVEALRDAVAVSSGASRVTPPQSTVFISYSHQDLDFVKRILVHLRPLERAGLITAWSDTRLTAGDDWREHIRSALDRARVAILLISADFIASEFIMSDELPPLLVAAQLRGVRIVPVIVKPSRFLRDPKLNRFQALNEPTRPLIDLPEGDREAAYARLADVVEAAVGFTGATA